MNPELIPFQQLDEVLFLFDPKVDNRGINNLTINELLIKHNLAIQKRRLTEILYKLVKDEFLRIEVTSANYQGKIFENVDYYLLTLEGELMQQHGGYTEEDKSLKAKRRFEEERIIRSEKNAERLNTLTFWLVVGSIELAIIEIVKLIFYK